MNLAFGARTNWGKTYVSIGYIERNADDYDLTVVLDYKDEYSGLVETGYLKRLTAPPGLETASREQWAEMTAGTDGLQVARAGMTDDAWREMLATLIRALAADDRSVFLVLDEAHRFAPQRGGYPDEIDTLATTYHGDGFGVVWLTQRFAKLDEDILSQCTASMLGGFGSGADLDKVGNIVEYNPDVHNADLSRVTGSVPDALQVDGEAVPLRRFTDDAGNTVGSEWVYSDDTSLRRIDSRDLSMESPHYGSDRKRINHPFERE